MPTKLGVIMDPIADINRAKDTTYAMLLEAQRREWDIYYIEQHDLFFKDAACHANMQLLKLDDTAKNWYHLDNTITQTLDQLDLILLRKDPPFDAEYLYTTYLLELAAAKGVHVINRPSSVRDANEKLFTAWFPQCMPPTLVTRHASLIKDFITEHNDIVLKPLNEMGGRSIFKIKKNDPNTNVIIETITQNGASTIMAQRFIPEIKQGDKRILMINGEPIPYALARIPTAGEFRGNLAAGGTGEGRELTTRDRWICEQVGTTLKEKGLSFVGLDVIGDYLTEINVTSPTCVRELDSLFKLNISATFFDAIT